MRLRTKYILFVSVLHLAALVLSYYIFEDKKEYFILSEAFILLSAIIAIRLHLQMIKPINSLMQGIEAIKDKDFNVKFLKTGSVEVDQLIHVYNDMMDELRTERTRQEQQHFFLEQMINSSPTGIVILDFDGRVHDANPKALSMLGATIGQLKGITTADLKHPLFSHITALKSGDAQTVILDGVDTLKIQKSHFIDRGFARQFVMIEDLTAELLQAEKKVYSKIIRMMAHEVNNTIGPVNSIMGSALNTNRLWDGHQSDNLKDALQVAIDRNQNLNSFMRGLADLVKLPPANKQPLDVNKLIRNVSALMNLKASEKQITFEYELPHDEFMIQADEQQLEQALINIVKNAIEAIEGIGSIKFNLDTSSRELLITDSGKGLTTEESEQMFSPFFSTKKDGQGIGLTLVREILLGHDLSFSLKTIAPGQTEFRINFS
ncbi:sensor histidine kinase [Mucilaginibacter myungsuensis]|uniref:histidine kinase n=1 Tax=Mucilaginibacter myungsuensis TaxID=649104 RepID=A0A929KU32_9SPHI|nr:ATP-binding protein [Mucilaginibacter myungsuensis]MBE9660812.1 PAS domain-containing protein [Mucilaginibacter myungsuensis]MDN3600858.1 ATP-binding protein [Mucilaginibacter myungsuensis]